MAFYTYSANVDPNDHADRIRFRNGALILRMGNYADLTTAEVASVAQRVVLVPGTSGAAQDSGLRPGGVTSVGPTRPAAGVGEEYAWFKTDGDGTPLDILVGKGS